MKTKFKYIIGLALIACMGCSDWLDVNPRTELKQEIEYETENGYKEVLNGVYIQLASEDLYGKNMTMYFPELLLHTWVPENTTIRTVDYYIYNWDFENAQAEALIENIYKAYYRAIAHLNDILGHIDADKNLFQNGNYDLIKGEVLGLRGFLHLELLRLFGPVPDETAGSKAAIPYAEELSKDPSLFRTLAYDEVCSKIIRDLNAAEELLKNDPLVNADNQHLNNPTSDFGSDMEKPNDEWQFYRQVRFNLYAVKGAKARYYHWIGDKENAVKYAQEVINSEKFRLTNGTDYSSSADYEQNLVFLSEHLFGVDVPKLQTIVQPLFKDENATLVPFNVSSASKYPFIQNVYENTTNDIRYGNGTYWQFRNSRWHFLKYTGSDAIEASTQVPVLRLAEMYLILFEDLDQGAVRPYWVTFCQSRALPETWYDRFNVGTDIATYLEREWRKEFMGEGQAFFYYKKHGNDYAGVQYPTTSTNFGSVTFPEEWAFQIPLPDSQTIFD